MIRIKIAEDFTPNPGGRYINEGPDSGELFREKILLPAYKEAIGNKEDLIINLDDCYGFATSFLEEAFGGLVREVKNRKIKEVLVLETEDRPNLKDKIYEYIEKAIIK